MIPSHGLESMVCLGQNVWFRRFPRVSRTCHAGCHSRHELPHCPQPPTVSIAAVERDTGLSKDTLRVWERRYGFPQPERDAYGERVYPSEQVDKLRLVKRLMDQGHRPGKISGPSIELQACRGSGRPAHAVEAPDPDELARFSSAHRTPCRRPAPRAVAGPTGGRSRPFHHGGRRAADRDGGRSVGAGGSGDLRGAPVHGVGAGRCCAARLRPYRRARRAGSC